MHIKLLLIDYNLAVLEALKTVIESFIEYKENIHTYEVHTAKDVLDGFVKMMEENSNFNVIITEIKMPRINGIKLLDILSELQPQIPIIVLSGYTYRKQQKMMLEKKGAFAILLKPPSIDQLFETIHKAAEWNAAKLERGGL